MPSSGDISQLADNPDPIRLGFQAWPSARRAYKASLAVASSARCQSASSAKSSADAVSLVGVATGRRARTGQPHCRTRRTMTRRKHAAAGRLPRLRDSNAAHLSRSWSCAEERQNPNHQPNGGTHCHERRSNCRKPETLSCIRPKGCTSRQSRRLLIALPHSPPKNLRPTSGTGRNRQSGAPASGERWMGSRGGRTRTVLPPMSGSGLVMPSRPSSDLSTTRKQSLRPAMRPGAGPPWPRVREPPSRQDRDRTAIGVALGIRIPTVTLPIVLRSRCCYVNGVRRRARRLEATEAKR